jgi:hypothetical protein
MFGHASRVVVLTAALAASSVHALVEDFSSDPFATWSFGVGDNSNSQFTWNTDLPKYTGDAAGSLTVNLNSSLPTARLDRPLGGSYTDTDSFTLATRFSFQVTSAPGDQFMQIAFGLVNSSLTGGDRTGADVYHTVEFNYFPNVSTFFGTGPTVSPAVFGANKAGNAFNNFAAFFFSEADLGDNTTGITELPQGLTLEATLTYNGAAKTLALTIHRVEADGSLTLLDIEQPPMSLISLPPFSNYDGAAPFVVDTLAIMAYRDGYTSAADPSLVAAVTFERFEFTVIPEPSTALLTLSALAALGLLGRRR